MGPPEWHVFQESRSFLVLIACQAMGPTSSTDISGVQELLGLFETRLRTMSSFGPGHPIHDPEEAKLKESFTRLWEQMSRLPLLVTETGLLWEADCVLPIELEKEGFAWALSQAGIRFLAFFPGVEEEEALTLLAAIHRSRALTEVDVDDLLTLLWTADFQYIQYKAPEIGEQREAQVDEEQPRASSSGPKAEEVRRRVEQEVREVEERASTRGIVDLDEYESTLYFLDNAEIGYLKREIEREYSQDLGRNVLSLLFDTFELQIDTEVRAEVIDILTDMLPQLLICGDFRSVSFLISEARVVLRKAPRLESAHRTQLNQLARGLSVPDAVEQLMQALDEARLEPSEKELQELLTELTSKALMTTLKWLPRLSNERARTLLNQAISHLAESRSDLIQTALGSGDFAVILEALRIVEERKLTGLSEPLVTLAEHEDVRVRTALVPALIRAPTAQTMQALVTLLGDPDPNIRIGAVQGLSSHMYIGALEAVEAVVLNPGRHV